MESTWTQTTAYNVLASDYTAMPRRFVLIMHHERFATVCFTGKMFAKNNEHRPFNGIKLTPREKQRMTILNPRRSDCVPCKTTTSSADCGSWRISMSLYSTNPVNHTSPCPPIQGQHRSLPILVFSLLSLLLPKVSAACLFCFYVCWLVAFMSVYLSVLVQWLPTVPISTKSQDPSGVDCNS